MQFQLAFVFSTGFTRTLRDSQYTKSPTKRRIERENKRVANTDEVEDAAPLRTEVTAD
jgi:hypothetical protein